MALVDTMTLTDAEGIVRGMGIASEIDYERAKAQHRVTTAKVGHDLDAAVRIFEQGATSRGIDYVTFRRLSEAIGPSSTDITGLRRHLIDTRPEHYDWPLWSLTARTVNLAR